MARVVWGSFEREEGQIGGDVYILGGLGTPFWGMICKGVRQVLDSKIFVTLLQQWW